MLQENEPNEEREPEMITTDADTVNESVETKWRKIRVYYPKSLRLFSRKDQVLIEEVFNMQNHKQWFSFLHDAGQ